MTSRLRRPEHRKAKSERGCARCGLSLVTQPRCPPGYWMTSVELRRWFSLPADERAAFEQLCAEKRA